ncbi:TonB-dependent receptor [Sphingomonas sp. CGMCC 1.13654]|uniref:TonB-dependent receptor n=1 Tax=Sphingomonas chungangi TaxID=2683589 RepID=A0A838L010_9SPHN|nr:TonB-dependent receptor [Sphingomonas chungangi]MBA2932554.1 TonB-dependent receptor [Sphingomonas chungangi]
MLTFSGTSAGEARAASADGPVVRVDVDAQPLAQAVVVIGEQADLTIGLGDTTLGDVRVHAFHGSARVSRALAHILRGTSAVARFTGDRVVRIERARMPPRSTVRPEPQAIDIVVTGSKRGTVLAAYPGSAIVVSVADIPLAMRSHGSEALVSELPILSSTHLGSGRNKLFIRGIADSSFNGPSQSTVGQYLGEARLTYNAPDPDLALYDIAETEVLEGPQGTLYGAGTLGGIVRLDPVRPDLDRFGYGLSLGASTTRDGTASSDAAGLINLPVKKDVIGVRGLVYESTDGGYIDDPGRGLSNINRTRTHGGRLELRVAPSPTWTIDATGVVQDINARDGDYADRTLPKLQRRSTLSQPFDNDYSLANLVARHTMGATELVSSTTIVRHDVSFTYDATEAGGPPRLFRENDHISLVTNEMRLSHQYDGGGSWVVGLEALQNVDRIRRLLGAPSNPAAISGSRNKVFEAALFGEATVALAPSFSVTAGGRVAYNRVLGEALDHVEDAPEPDRRRVAFLPSIGALWRVAPDLALYARYQEGFRPGGLSVSDTAVERYRGDGLSTVELGVRMGYPSSRLQATSAISFARWRNIQADLIDGQGLPLTTNVGNGRVVGLEASVQWRPWRDLDIESGLFLNDSTLYRPAPGFAGEKDASLPNVDDLGFRASANLRIPLGKADSLSFYGALRYVGGSKLGVGTALDFPQGHYVATNAGVRWDCGRYSVSLDASNLLDDGRNQFALGNPFQLAGGTQITPFRPRTFRLGLSTGF